jgi:hypothetical protein
MPQENTARQLYMLPFPEGFEKPKIRRKFGETFSKLSPGPKRARLLRDRRKKGVDVFSEWLAGDLESRKRHQHPSTPG